MTGWKARFQIRRTHDVLIDKTNYMIKGMQGVVAVRDEMKDEQGLLSQNCPCFVDFEILGRVVSASALST